mmetsp:Transcript_14840/g.33688  ORF Transcript_14840/g.33688 Transcript_14840/m.33688 type:complete len:216 (+) Transcript_14840:271-918(+)
MVASAACFYGAGVADEHCLRGSRQPGGRSSGGRAVWLFTALGPHGLHTDGPGHAARCSPLGLCYKKAFGRTLQGRLSASPQTVSLGRYGVGHHWLGHPRSHRLLHRPGAALRPPAACRSTYHGPGSLCLPLPGALGHETLRALLWSADYGLGLFHGPAFCGHLTGRWGGAGRPRGAAFAAGRDAAGGRHDRLCHHAPQPLLTLRPRSKSGGAPGL